MAGCDRQKALKGTHETKLTTVDQTTDGESATREKSPAGGPDVVPDGKDDTSLGSEGSGILTTTAPQPEESYPEGGLRAWLVVLGSWFALFSSLGLMNTLAAFQAYVSGHQLAHYSSSTIGWIFSVFSFLVFFLGIYIGPIFDKYGPRWLILSGTLTLTAGLMLLSISSKYWHFLLAFSVLVGSGSSLMWTPSIAAIGHFFLERRGLATGVGSTAGSLGGVVFPLLLESLFNSVGWGWAIRITGFICLALSAASNFLIRSRLPPAENSSPHPDFRIFRDMPFLLTTIAIFFLEFALFIPLTYISSYALSKGFSDTLALRLPTILNAGSFVGRILPGWYSDKMGPFNANIISVIISIVACLGIWLPAGHTTAGVVVFSILFGFSSGSNISLTPVAVGRLCKTQVYGRYYATCYTIVSIATLVGIPIAGKILSVNGGDYWGLIVFTGVLYVVSLAAFVAAKVSMVGWRLLANL